MLKQVLHHVAHNPFVVFTGAAALVHSTWTIGYMTNGSLPPDALRDPAGSFAWHFTPFLIALCVDVGQVFTAHKIRVGGGNRARYATFAVFAIFTYYMQLLHVAHVLPTFHIGAGVAPALRPMVDTLISAFVFAYPALLPLSTFLYTISEEKADHASSVSRVADAGLVAVGVSAPIASAAQVVHAPSDQASALGAGADPALLPAETSSDAPLTAGAAAPAPLAADDVSTLVVVPTTRYGAPISSIFKHKD